MTLTDDEKSLLKFFASCPRGLIVPELTWGHIDGTVGEHYWNDALGGLYDKGLIKAEKITYDGRDSSRIIVTDLGQQIAQNL